MKSILTVAAWTLVTLIIIYVAVNPQSGIIYTSPSAALGVGLIGMGLCMEARKRLGRGSVQPATSRVE
jgi:hypothetical protein